MLRPQKRTEVVVWQAKDFGPCCETQKILTSHTNMFNIIKLLKIVTNTSIYKICDDNIIKYKGYFHKEIICFDTIKCWQVYYEMGFDVFEIRKIDGTVLIWIDYLGDLSKILHENLSSKRVD